MRFRLLAPTFALILSLAGLSARADVRPHPLFTDHAVLQQGMDIPVWGWADTGEAVNVTIGGSTASTVARDGKWLVRLRPIQETGPHTLTIAGKNTVVVQDVIIGEVWVCGGQSNMERQLGPRDGQKPIVDWEKEAAAATYPQIRHFLVAQARALTPQASVEGRWVVCSPETVKDFSAVGYFFARQLHRARKVPVGLIHSSWGGTPAEAWMSPTGLRTQPDFADALAQLALLTAKPAEADETFRTSLQAWFREFDPGSNEAMNFSAATVDTATWPPVTLPAMWEDAGMPGFDGVVWFRTEFDLPESWQGETLRMHLGAIDDLDTTWINGHELGTTAGWRTPRVYTVPAHVLRPGRNTIAVRVLDTGGGGGLWGGDDTMRIQPVKPAPQALSLAGPWWRKASVNLANVRRQPPADFTTTPAAPTVLYQGMIAPLLPYAIRGVIFYQGESNNDRAAQYRTLFPALIADWRRSWGQGEFPFLFVQIAPFRSMRPELREAQLLAWQTTPKTAMVVTLDCGDAEDIHPANKAPVGARLALAARAIAYGERIDYSGPVFEKISFDHDRSWLTFTHRGGGLACADGGSQLKGFTVAGKDGVFHPALAGIKGDRVLVWSEKVREPVAVRYAWANVPEGNLINRAGLPASPFRTDIPAAGEPAGSAK